jgi:hypothetical protein
MLLWFAVPCCSQWSLAVTVAQLATGFPKKLNFYEAIVRWNGESPAEFATRLAACNKGVPAAKQISYASGLQGQLYQVTLTSVYDAVKSASNFSTTISHINSVWCMNRQLLMTASKRLDTNAAAGLKALVHTTLGEVRGLVLRLHCIAQHAILLVLMRFTSRFFAISNNPML